MYSQERIKQAVERAECVWCGDQAVPCQDDESQKVYVETGECEECQERS